MQLYRLLVINKYLKSFLPIIKPLRDINCLHIMFCCQFPFMLYAEHTKNWFLYFGKKKARKSSWTKFSNPNPNCIFSFQIVSVEKNKQDQADIVLDWFHCFRFWIFLRLCSWHLKIGFSSLRRRRCFYSRQRRWFLGRQRNRAWPLEIICN